MLQSGCVMCSTTTCNVVVEGGVIFGVAYSFFMYQLLGQVPILIKLGNIPIWWITGPSTCYPTMHVSKCGSTIRIDLGRCH